MLNQGIPQVFTLTHNYRVSEGRVGYKIKEEMI